MRVRGKVTLVVPIESAEGCEVVMRSLMPDETGLPPGLSSSIRCDNGKLVYELSYDINSDEFLSVYNTLDDLLRNVRIVMNSLDKL